MFYGQDIELSTALFIALAGFTTVILILLLISVIIRCISKIVILTEKLAEKKKNKNTTEAQQVNESEQAAGSVPQAKRAVTPGFVELIDVDEPTAAVIMAIVSSKTGIAPEKLAFSSIKLIGEAKTNEV